MCEIERIEVSVFQTFFQLQELKGVITKNESENSDRIEEMRKQHKKALAEAEDKVKKLEGAREKIEKTKEEAIQALNEKIRSVSSLVVFTLLFCQA